jgi:hypothetical protein
MVVTTAIRTAIGLPGGVRGTGQVVIHRAAVGCGIDIGLAAVRFAATGVAPDRDRFLARLHGGATRCPAALATPILVADTALPIPTRRLAAPVASDSSTATTASPPATAAASGSFLAASGCRGRRGSVFRLAAMVALRHMLRGRWRWPTGTIATRRGDASHQVLARLHRYHTEVLTVQARIIHQVDANLRFLQQFLVATETILAQKLHDARVGVQAHLSLTRVVTDPPHHPLDLVGDGIQ